MADVREAYVGLPLFAVSVPEIAPAPLAPSPTIRDVCARPGYATWGGTVWNRLPHSQLLSGIQMQSESRSPRTVDDPRTRQASESLSANVSQNIERISAFHERELRKISNSQRRLEYVSRLLARPLALVVLLLVVVLWISWNSFSMRLDMTPFDPSPFPRLQGLLTLAAVLTTTVVLIAQNRHAKVESQRAHLDLQVNLLTEQKVTKLIHLLEELRRDLPMVRDRHDPEAASLLVRTDAAQVLSALEDVGAVRRGKGTSDDET
jgi:uncharacterized membrane protein